MLTITILDRLVTASPPTIHQMQMLMYISAPRMIKAVSLVLRGLGQHVTGHRNTDHLSTNIYEMMQRLRLYVIYNMYMLKITYRRRRCIIS